MMDWGSSSSSEKPGAQVDVALAGGGIVGDLVRVQLIHHLLEGGGQAVVVIERELPGGQSDLFEIVGAADALGLGFGLRKRGQQHCPQDAEDGEHGQDGDHTIPAATHR